MPIKVVSETLLEIREHPKAGYKVLVVRMPLPTLEAMNQYRLLAKLEQTMAARHAKNHG